MWWSLYKWNSTMMFLEEESHDKYRSDAKALVPIGYSAVCGEGKVQTITVAYIKLILSNLTYIIRIFYISWTYIVLRSLITLLIIIIILISILKCKSIFSTSLLFIE